MIIICQSSLQVNLHLSQRQKWIWVQRRRLSLNNRKEQGSQGRDESSWKGPSSSSSSEWRCEFSAII